jgi:hypothetical protein
MFKACLAPSILLRVWGLGKKKFVLNEDAMREMGYSNEQIKLVKKETLKIFAPTTNRKVCRSKSGIKAES